MPCWCLWTDHGLQVLAEQLRTSPLVICRLLSYTLVQPNFEKDEDRNGYCLWGKILLDVSVLCQGHTGVGRGWAPCGWPPALLPVITILLINGPSGLGRLPVLGVYSLHACALPHAIHTQKYTQKFQSLRKSQVTDGHWVNRQEASTAMKAFLNSTCL